MLKRKEEFKETTIRIKVELKDGIHKVEILCGNAGWLDIIRPMLNLICLLVSNKPFSSGE